jgi:hypothetical protein
MSILKCPFNGLIRSVTVLDKVNLVMPLLFSYGTLQHEDVQRSLFGRTLVGQKDYLLGYEPVTARVSDPEFARTSGKARHAILRPAHSAARVEGTALEVTDAELRIADRYEPAEYKRVEAMLASGRKTWVYVDAQRTDPHVSC